MGHTHSLALRYHFIAFLSKCSISQHLPQTQGSFVKSEQSSDLLPQRQQHGDVEALEEVHPASDFCGALERAGCKQPKSTRLLREFREFQGGRTAATSASWRSWGSGQDSSYAGERRGSRPEADSGRGARTERSRLLQRHLLFVRSQRCSVLPVCAP